MMFSDLLRTLLRHRALFFGGVMFTAVLCVIAYLAAPPVYRAESSVILLNPPELPERRVTDPETPAEFENPYVRFGDLSVVVDVLVRVIESEATVESLREEGLSGTFQVAANRDFYRGPIVDIAAEASTPDAAVADAALVVERISSVVSVLQAEQGTISDYQIRSELVVGASEASAVWTPTIRVMLVAMALGLVLTVASCLLADWWKTRRATRSMGGPGADAGADDEPAPDEMRVSRLRSG